MTYSGRITGGAPGWFIALWAQTTTGWQGVAWTRTVDGIHYTINYAAPNPGALTVRTGIGGTVAGALALSAPRSLTVQNRSITLTPPAPAYTALINVALVGRVVPAEPGRAVAIDFIYQGAWRPLAIVTTDAAGNYRIPIPDNFPYHWIVRTRTFESPASAVEYSAAGTFDVMAYLHPVDYLVSAADVSKTYRSGCPVGPSSLRRLLVNHWGLDSRLHRGELIVRLEAVPKMVAVWNAAIVNRFPVRQMRRVDVFGGNDVVSMAADNTSVFNCRTVTGNPFALSPHAYGYAIDINTVENPYQDSSGRWYPSNGLAYIDRSNVRVGMLFDASTPTRALLGQSYMWGKIWAHPDYQHFQPK